MQEHIWSLPCPRCSLATGHSASFAALLLFYELTDQFTWSFFPQVFVTSVPSAVTTFPPSLPTWPFLFLSPCGSSSGNFSWVPRSEMANPQLNTPSTSCLPYLTAFITPVFLLSLFLICLSQEISTCLPWLHFRNTGESSTFWLLSGGNGLGIWIFITHRGF